APLRGGDPPRRCGAGALVTRAGDGEEAGPVRPVGGRAVSLGGMRPQERVPRRHHQPLVVPAPGPFVVGGRCPFAGATPADPVPPVPARVRGARPAGHARGPAGPPPAPVPAHRKAVPRLPTR